MTIGSEVQAIPGRQAAVAKAKEISARSGRVIQVERADGRVRMAFRRGRLETYRFETQDRRKS